MNSFFDLQTSQTWSDNIKFNLFTELLTRLFNVQQIEKDHVYQYSTKMETEENHAFILANWDIVCLFGFQNEYFKKNKRLVYSVIDHIITCLNEKYKFVNPIKFEHERVVKQAEYGSKKTITLTYYNLKFV
jgi:hypothetical protein